MENDPRTYAIIGAAMEVHRQLGCGFLEGVYQEALELEFTARGIPFVAQVELRIRYKGQLLETYYQADMLCYDSIVVELKALARLGGVEEAQVLNYLKATGHEIGLLLNFGCASLGTSGLSAASHLQSDPQISQISQIENENSVFILQICVICEICGSIPKALSALDVRRPPQNCFSFPDIRE